MVYINAAANVARRFSLDRLYVAPELVGAEHTFVFEGRRVTLVLPNVESTDVPFEHRRIRLRSWKTEGNVPLEYEVYDLEIDVEITESIRVPEEMLRLHPNQFGLLTQKEQAHLDEVVADTGKSLSAAFNYWLRVLRWKSAIGYIGEPSIRYPGGQASAVLRERVTQHRMWVQSGMTAVTGGRRVTLADWDATQAALSDGKKPPVWFEFLFDSQMRINNDDLVGAVLSLAIALEVNVRFVFADELRKAGLQPVILEVFDLTNMRTLLNRLKKLRQWDSHWASSTDFDAFHKLMNHRDRVMHTANTEDIDAKELRKMNAAVSKFAYFTCDALNLS